MFGPEMTSAETKLENYQATTQYGNAYGATRGKGSATAGGVVINLSKAGAVKNNTKGGSLASTSSSGTTSNVVTNVITNDPTTAIESIYSNTSLALKSMEYNQSLSTLAISAGQKLATDALQTLQTLGPGQQTLAAGGNASDIADITAMTQESITGFTMQNKKLFAGVVIVAVLAIGYAIYKH